MPIVFPKKDVSRLLGHWLCFGNRISPLTGSPRLAVNPPNAILNYLYALLEAEALRAVSSMGLDPCLGILHADTPHRNSLVLDVLEPARAQIDAYVIDAFLRQPLRKDWFFEEHNGNARLMASLTSQLSETALLWARAIAPVAEWVAQMLWSRKNKGGEELLRTRLTQRRKSEGRGNAFIPVTVKYTRRPRICEVCGAEGVRNRYCRSCGVEISRENMTRAALVGHARPKTAQVRKQISKKISDHAIANTWWSPSTLPPWLKRGILYSEDPTATQRAKGPRDCARHASLPPLRSVHPLGPTPPASEALAGVGGIGRYYGLFEQLTDDMASDTASDACASPHELVLEHYISKFTILGSSILGHREFSPAKDANARV